MGVRPVGVSIGSLSKFFPQHEIEAILRASGREGQRRRKLPALDLVYYVIALGLYASEGCRSVLRRVLLSRRARDGEEIDRLCSDAAITQGRTRLGWQPLRALYEVVVRPIATRATMGAWYRRWRLVTLDGSTLDVADTKRNERAFGRPDLFGGSLAFRS
ncbi:MAG: transposase domain-containing protein [Thermoanaerobaculia bacterium]